MNFIFVGQFVEEGESLKDYQYSQAANRYQKKIIDFTQPEIAISVVPVFIRDKQTFSYPYNKAVFIHNACPVRNKNLAYAYKLLIDTFQAFRMIRRSAIDRVWFYNVTISTYGIAWLLRCFTKKKCYVIIADYSISRSFLQKRINKMISKFSGSIVLNSNIPHTNRIILPGLLYDHEIKLNQKSILKKNILFSGSLGRTTGFEFALSFFQQNPEYNLYITGSPFNYQPGEFDILIKRALASSKNIFYHGLLPYQQYNEILELCDVALSLRDPLDDQHDYNFPSKILEYLSRGKLVISTRQYPDIDKDIFFYSSTEGTAFKETLNRIFQLSSLELLQKKEMINAYVTSRFSKMALVNAIESL